MLYNEYNSQTMTKLTYESTLKYTLYMKLTIHNLAAHMVSEVF